MDSKLKTLLRIFIQLCEDQEMETIEKYAEVLRKDFITYRESRG